MLNTTGSSIDGVELAEVKKEPVTETFVSEQQQRVLQINGDNSAGGRRKRGFIDNYITTSKYTLLSFLPKNLVEQFMRMVPFFSFKANTYQF